MAALDPTKSRVMEFVAAFVIVAFTGIEGFITIAPYIGMSASGGDIASLAQQQTLVQTIMIALISFLFGASVGTQKKDDAISTLAATQAAQTNGSGTPDRTVTVEPGEVLGVASPPQPKVKT